MFSLRPFALQAYDWTHDFFQANAAVLEGILVVVVVVIVVVRIEKKLVLLGENVARAHVRRRQSCIGWLTNFQDITFLIGEVAT